MTDNRYAIRCSWNSSAAVTAGEHEFKLNDLDTELGIVQVLGKGRKERRVLSGRQSITLRKWTQILDPGEMSGCFRTQWQNISPRTIQKSSEKNRYGSAR